MQLADFFYDLPDGLIAQHPCDERTSSRLLQVTPDGLRHRQFADVTTLLAPGDLLVLNNTRVLKARLFAVKDSGGQAEVLVERLVDDHQAMCQVRVSKPLKSGRTLQVGKETLTCVAREGEFYRLSSEMPFASLLERYGHMPLPPYVERPDESSDAERYQTVYGRIPGAVAAPTAGLHFSRTLLATLRENGVRLAELTLHVGAGTFQPVRGDLDCHRMHREWYEIDAAAATEIHDARVRGARVVAVGTTVVRALESAAITDNGEVPALQGETRLFIKPGFEFNVVDALITNFHLPGSTLLMLVCAFAGYEEVMSAYRAAVQARYRFFSYGDAMWLERKRV